MERSCKLWFAAALLHVRLEFVFWEEAGEMGMRWEPHLTKGRQVLALLLVLCAVALAEGERITLASAGSIMAKALPESMDSWPAIVAGWYLFSFWSTKVGIRFAWPKKSQVYWYGYLLIGKTIWLWRLRTLFFLNGALRGNCHQGKHQSLFFQTKYCLFQIHFKHFVNLNTFTRPFFL